MKFILINVDFSYTNRRKVESAFVGLFIAMFPVFGLTETDVTGQETLPLNSPTILFKIAHLSVCCLILLAMYRYWPRPRIIGRKFNWFFFLYIGGFAFSIFFNNALDVKAWFKMFEVFIITSLALISFYNIAYEISFEAATKVFLDIVIKQFWLILFALGILVLVNKDLVINLSEERGNRLGGSFIHPNTLGLGSVLFLISSFTQWKLGYVKGTSFVWCLFVTALVVLLTGSFSSTLVFIITIFFICYIQSNRTTKGLANIIVLFLIIVLCTFFKLNFLNDIVSSNVTWIDRAEIYQNSIAGIHKFPLFGVGAFEGVRRYLSSVDIFRYYIPIHTHNLLLELFLARGIVLAAPLALIIISLYFISYYRLLKVKSRPLINCFYLIFIVLVTHGMVESSFFGAEKPFCHTYLVLCCLAIYSASRELKKGIGISGRMKES